MFFFVCDGGHWTISLPAVPFRAHVTTFTGVLLCRYAADMASQHFQISLEKTGMVVRVWGFSHKQMALVTAILEHMRDFQCDSQPFAMVKETLIRQHRNSLKKRERYARSLRLQMLMGYEWPASDLIAELESVTVADLLGHVASVLNQGFLKALTHGNQPAEFCREVVDTTTRVLGIKSLPREAFPDVPVHEVPAGEHWLVVPTVNEADDTSMVECYYQIGGADDRHYVLTDLLVDLMSEPIFNELRTNQQLGYADQPRRWAKGGQAIHTGALFSCAAGTRWVVRSDSPMVTSVS